MKYLTKHWLFLLPLAVLSFYYLFQNIIGVYRLPLDLVAPFAAMLLLSACSYAAAYRWVPARWLDAMRVVTIRPAIIEMAAIGLVAAYLLLLVAASVTSEGVALIEAFKGATGYELGVLRETFLRTRTGGWQLLNYAYAIMNNALMPVVVTYAYQRRLRWRHVALTIFVIGLSLTLSKGAIASAALPLMALFLMERRFRAAAGALFMLFGVIGAMYFLSSGRLGAAVIDTAGETALESGQTTAETSPIIPESQIQNASDVPDNYNIIGRSDQLSLAVNRIVWIPYATAVDWLRYQRDYMDGRLLLGRSIKPVAAALGWEHLSLERNVAAMQWGQNETGTASSNAVYFVDAWVNFGALGVVLYSALLALTIKLIETSGSKPLAAAAAVPVYTACFVALPPVYLSGGLGLFVLMALVRTSARTSAFSTESSPAPG